MEHLGGAQVLIYVSDQGGMKISRATISIRYLDTYQH